MRLVQLNNEMEGDELLFKFGESSPNASSDSKKRRTRFTKVQRSGNWFVVDLGTIDVFFCVMCRCCAHVDKCAYMFVCILLCCILTYALPCRNHMLGD